MRKILWKFRRKLRRWFDCRLKKCDYYTHYLAYGPADLTHEGYHAACDQCQYWQKRDFDYFEAHPEAIDSPFRRQCKDWERRVRA